MATRDATDDNALEFPLLGGLNQRPSNAALPPPDFDLVHGLYMKEAGSLTRLPGVTRITSVAGRIYQIRQLEDGTGSIVVQTDDGTERLFTLAEIFDREGDESDITIIPDGGGVIGSTEDSFVQALIVHEEAQGTDGGAIGAALNTWYGWKLTANPVNESTIVTTFRDYDNGAVTFTVTIATPAIFTKAAHGLAANDRVWFVTSGALPTGLTINTTYYVIAAGLTADDFEVSTTQGGAAVNTTGSQSGVHTMYINPSSFDLAAGTYRIEAHCCVNTTFVSLNNDLRVCTIPVASPGTVGSVAHGLPAGSSVKFIVASGNKLPVPLTDGTIFGTTYFVSSTNLTADTFEIAATYAAAIAGTGSINITTAGIGPIFLRPTPKAVSAVGALYNETDGTVVGVTTPVFLNALNPSFGGNPSFTHSRQSNLLMLTAFTIDATKRFSFQVAAGSFSSAVPWVANGNARGETHGVTTSLGGSAVVNRYLAIKITKENE